MMKRLYEAPPRTVARIAGILYLLDIATSLLGDSLLGSTHVVPGAAAPTATSIITHESLLRLGVAADLFATACYVGVTILFYALFKAVNTSLARLVMFTSLTALAIWTFGGLSELAATLVLPGGDASGSQADQHALMFLEWNSHASSIGSVVFGAYCLLFGNLIVRSVFLPRVLGILMMSGGAGLLTYLSPRLASDLYPYNAAPALAAETSLMLWLLLLGVNIPRRHDRAPHPTHGKRAHTRRQRTREANPPA
jgi:hypothetical protein